MTYDSAATKERLLSAAYHEFVQAGLAGARVDRIAAAAQANKQAIYAYFGSKEALFDSVLAARLRILADEVPFTADLAEYAGALFDALGADPGLQRLTQWKMLERPDATAGERHAHISKASEIAAHFGVDIDTATDAVMIALAAAQIWNATAADIRNPSGANTDDRRGRHRAAITAAVAAMTPAVMALGAAGGDPCHRSAGAAVPPDR